MEFKNTLIFVSDCKSDYKPEVYQQLVKHFVITQYSNLFTNRSLVDLQSRNINCIWIDINNAEALKWLKVYVLSNKKDDIERDYNLISVYKSSGGINQAWISDINGDLAVKYEKLLSINCLNKADFLNEMLALGIKVSKPVIHKLLSCVCDSRFVKK